MLKPVNKKLVLEDGSVYQGIGFGYTEDKFFEIVFNTSMVGYQEIISDPSYTYQGVVMTYPIIGNYGINDDDYETGRPSISAMIVRDYCDYPSNFRYSNTLSEVMEKYEIAGIYGLDTRKLARHIRDNGCMKACIVSIDASTEDTVNKLKAYEVPRDAVSKVSTKEIYDYVDDQEGKAMPFPGCTNIQAGIPERKANDLKVVAIDCGMKKNILRCLYKKGCDITVVPFDTPSDKIAAYNPDGIFISNGPGDPEDVTATIATIKNLIGKYPIFGICLGHQIISLAYGAKTYKLKFGHRGGNHPVKNLKKNLVEITSQNHSYAVKDDSLDGTGLTATHINLLDNTIEGVECTKDTVFSVQYHPESAPGPQDSSYLFEEFIDNMNKTKEDKANA